MIGGRGRQRGDTDRDGGGHHGDEVADEVRPEGAPGGRIGCRPATANEGRRILAADCSVGRLTAAAGGPRSGAVVRLLAPGASLPPGGTCSVTSGRPFRGHRQGSGPAPQLLRGAVRLALRYAVTGSTRGFPPGGYGFVELIATADGTGIRGGVGGGAAFEPHALFYVGVPNVEAALQRAENLGGTRVLGPVTSPSGLVVGHFTDPEGNLLGVAGTG